MKITDSSGVPALSPVCSMVHFTQSIVLSMHVSLQLLITASNFPYLKCCSNQLDLGIFQLLLLVALRCDRQFKGISPV